MLVSSWCMGFLWVCRLTKILSSSSGGAMGWLEIKFSFSRRTPVILKFQIIHRLRVFTYTGVVYGFQIPGFFSVKKMWCALYKKYIFLIFPSLWKAGCGLYISTWINRVILWLLSVMGKFMTLDEIADFSKCF